MTLPTLLLKLSTDLCWYLALVRPILPLLPGAAAWALLALPAIYAAAVLIRRKRSPKNALFEDVFNWQCGILLAAAPVECLVLGFSGWESGAAWACLFLCLGLLLRRTCRLGEKGQRDRRFWLENVLSLGGAALAAALGASKAARHAAAAALGFLYERLMVPLVVGVATAFAWLVNGVIWLLKKIFSGLDLRPLPEDFMELPQPEQEVPALTNPASSRLPPWMQAAAWVLLFLLIAAVVWLVYRKLTKRDAAEQESGVWLHREPLPVRREGRSRRRERGGRSVRAYYRRFLRLCRRSGLAIEPQDSSAEIQKKAASHWPEAHLSPLRELYLEARYSPRPSTPQAAAAAREEYRRLAKK